MNEKIKNKILCGKALEVLKQLPKESVDCVMTSPPYWALRDYGIDGQLGLEKNFKDYISKLCDIFDQVKRVLKKTGTCWVNLGDTYSTTRYTGKGVGQSINKFKDGHRDINPQKITGLQDKNLTLIPFHFAIEMQNRGWILRNVIIWHKRNCMPSSVKDRFTVDFEYIFFFVKNKKYWFETQQEGENHYIGKITKKKFGGDGLPKFMGHANRMDRPSIETIGRNKRTVWTINTQPFSEAHFAVYPEELCVTPIKAGCPEFVCMKCGQPKKQVNTIKKGDHAFNIRVRDVKEGRIKHTDRVASEKEVVNYNEKEYKPTFNYTISEGCSCNASFEGGIVLDPFVGSGTTCLVAKRLNRNYIGIDINPEYCKLAEKRISGFNSKDFKAERKHKILNEVKP